MFGELEDADIKDVLGVDMVAFVEFDIEEGTVLTHQHPDTAAAMSASVQFLANCCLPDGSHFHQTDQSYLILPTQDGDIKYGIGFFRNKSDKTVSRGAIQRALLVISRYPHFHLFEQASYEILEASMEDTCNQMDLLKRLYNAFQIEEKKISTTAGLDCAYHHAPVTVFDHTYSFNIPVYYPKCKFLGTTSLVSLLSIVKDSILHIWYYLLHEKRILFVGEKAQSVGMCCLTACLLIQPLIADETSIIPYITLPDIDVLLSKKQYIAGTTNQLLLQREAWYDLAIDLTTGQVFEGNKEKVKYTKTDKIFVKHLFQQTESDAWIEDQFNQFTLNFLLNYRDNESKKLQKLFPNFRDSQLYKNFMASKENRTILRKFKEKKDAMQQSKLKSSASIELRPNARQKNAVKRLSASIKHYSIISKPHKLREPKNLNTSVSLNCMSSQDETLKPNEDRTIQFSSIQEDSSTVEHTEESNGIERRRYKYKKEPRPKSEGDMSSFGKNSSIIEISDMEEEELFWIAAQDSDTS